MGKKSRRSGPRVRVGPSSIHNAGLGVFVRKAIGVGTVITEYPGVVVPFYDADRESPYVHSLPNQRALVGDGSTWSSVACGHLINDFAMLQDPDRVDEYISESVPRANIVMEWSELDEKLKVVASRDINKGEELFYHYGPRYWLIHLLKIWLKDGDLDRARRCEDVLVSLEGWTRRVPPVMTLKEETIVIGDRPATEEECRRYLLFYGCPYDIHDPWTLIKQKLLHERQ